MLIGTVMKHNCLAYEMSGSQGCLCIKHDVLNVCLKGPGLKRTMF